MLYHALSRSPAFRVSCWSCLTPGQMWGRQSNFQPELRPQPWNQMPLGAHGGRLFRRWKFEIIRLRICAFRNTVSCAVLHVLLSNLMLSWIKDLSWAKVVKAMNELKTLEYIQTHTAISHISYDVSRGHKRSFFVDAGLLRTATCC